MNLYDIISKVLCSATAATPRILWSLILILSLTNFDCAHIVLTRSTSIWNHWIHAHTLIAHSPGIIWLDTLGLKIHDDICGNLLKYVIYIITIFCTCLEK